jgi:hypothetical protein
MELPRYTCHKKVWALKIKDISPTQNSFVPEDKEYAEVELPPGWIEKHNPAPGGYYVVYEDGYKSYSPAAAFESGYTRF